MAKYSKDAQKKVEETMHEMHKGKLKSDSGKKVTGRSGGKSSSRKSK